MQEGPQAGLGRPRVGLVLLELGESKTTGAGSVPRLISSPQKSFDNWHRQAVYGSSLLGRFSNALIDLSEFALFHFRSACRPLENLAPHGKKPAQDGSSAADPSSLSNSSMVGKLPCSFSGRLSANRYSEMPIGLL